MACERVSKLSPTKWESSITATLSVGFEAPATKRPTAALGSNEIRTIKPSIFTDGVEARERAL